MTEVDFGFGWNAARDRVFEAEFNFARDAKAFAERISETDRWFIVPGSVKRTGKVVTWEWDGRDSDGNSDGSGRNVYLLDMLETVGYYGSPPQGRQAKLNGFPAPRSY